MNDGDEDAAAVLASMHDVVQDAKVRAPLPHCELTRLFLQLLSVMLVDGCVRRMNDRPRCTCRDCSCTTLDSATAHPRNCKTLDVLPAAAVLLRVQYSCSHINSFFRIFAARFTGQT